MLLRFVHPCRVAALTPEGDMTTIMLGRDTVVEAIPSTFIRNDITPTADFTITDGYTLINVPFSTFADEVDKLEFV